MMMTYTISDSGLTQLCTKRHSRRPTLWRELRGQRIRTVRCDHPRSRLARRVPCKRSCTTARTTLSLDRTAQSKPTPTNSVNRSQRVGHQEVTIGIYLGPQGLPLFLHFPLFLSRAFPHPHHHHQHHHHHHHYHHHHHHHQQQQLDIYSAPTTRTPVH